MSNRATLVCGVVLSVVGLGFLLPPVATMIAADACLDGGGSYKYEQRACDLKASHPYQSEPQAFALPAALIATGLVLIVWAVRAKEKEPAASGPP